MIIGMNVHFVMVQGLVEIGIIVSLHETGHG